jgi:hypothetical protein
MIDVLLQNLDRGPGQNAASIAGLEILPCMHVDLWPGSRNGMMLGKIKVKEFRDWTKLYLTDHSPAFTETQSGTAHGRKYTYQVAGFYPGDSAELRQFLGITEWVKFIVRIRDTHGVVRIIGDSLYGLEVDAESMIAAEMAGRRGTMVTFSGELAMPSALDY